MQKVIRPNKKATITIQPTAPFNYEGTFFRPSHFPSKLVCYEEGVLFQGIQVGQEVFGIRISEIKDQSYSRVKVEIYGESQISDRVKNLIKSEVITRYNLAGEIDDFINKYRNDKLLSGPIKRWSGMRPSIAYSLYGFLMVTTVLQNATVRRSVQMMDAMLENFGTKLVFAGKEVYVTWLPEKIDQVTEDDLRDLKVGYRAKIIKRLTDSFIQNDQLEEELRALKNKELVKKELLKLYGVGPQTVSYILFEGFHFYDALDHLSPWEAKIYSKLIYRNKKTPPEKIVKSARRRWGKWRMLAMHYLFEDLFWRRHQEDIPWLEEEIRM